MAWYKGVNYVKQYTEATCVPLAILNALKWAGNKRVGLKDLHVLANSTGSHTYQTVQKKVHNTLKKYCSKYLHFKYKRAKFNEIIKHLESDENNAVIFDYYIAIEGNVEVGHSVFIINHDKKHVMIINDGEDDVVKTLNITSKIKFKKEFFKKTFNYPVAYYLKKKISK